MLSLLQLIFIVILCIFLSVITEKIVKHTEHLCHLTHIAEFTISSVLVALITSLPELVVSLTSSFHHYSTLAFGNAIGSNMVNIALIMGLTAVVSNPLRFISKAESRTVFYPVLITFLPFLFIINGSISRFEGLLLVLSYPFYLRFLFPPQTTSVTKHQLSPSITSHIAKLIGLLVFLVAISEVLISIAQSFAAGLNLPPVFVGLFIIALGTSLPELLFNLRSVHLHHPSMAIGNVIGSCVANATLVVGLSALINPITFLEPLEFLLPAVEYVFVILLFLYFVRTKNQLQLWEGVVLVSLFVYYTAIELIIR